MRARALHPALVEHLCCQCDVQLSCMAAKASVLCPSSRRYEVRGEARCLCKLLPLIVTGQNSAATNCREPMPCQDLADIVECMCLDQGGVATLCGTQASCRMRASTLDSYVHLDQGHNSHDGVKIPCACRYLSAPDTVRLHHWRVRGECQQLRQVAATHNRRAAAEPPHRCAAGAHLINPAEHHTGCSGAVCTH